MACLASRASAALGASASLRSSRRSSRTSSARRPSDISLGCRLARVRWNEDYADPDSDVAGFNNHEPEAGVDALVGYPRGLPREAPAGTRWNYRTGEANLVGIVLSAVTTKPLARRSAAAGCRRRHATSRASGSSSSMTPTSMARASLLTAGSSKRRTSAPAAAGRVSASASSSAPPTLTAQQARHSDVALPTEVVDQSRPAFRPRAQAP